MANGEPTFVSGVGFPEPGEQSGCVVQEHGPVVRRDLLCGSPSSISWREPTRPGALSMAGLGVCLSGPGRGRADRRGVVLLCARHAGHEDRAAAVHRRHQHVRHEGRLLPARHLHGTAADRLVQRGHVLRGGVVLKGIGFGEHAMSLFGEGGQFSVVFVVTAIVWGYLFAFLGAMGIDYVAQDRTFFPIVPIVMLIIAAAAAWPHVGEYKPKRPDLARVLSDDSDGDRLLRHGGGRRGRFL